jgi:hypothetical protein
MITIQMMFNHYFGDTFMTNITPNPAVAKPDTAADTKQIVLKEIGVNWSKFSQQDLAALKGKDDLVTQVVAKYSMEKGQAQREVDTLLKGRSI